MPCLPQEKTEKMHITYLYFIVSGYGKLLKHLLVFHYLIWCKGNISILNMFLLCDTSSDKIEG